MKLFPIFLWYLIKKIVALITATTETISLFPQLYFLYQKTDSQMKEKSQQQFVVVVNHKLWRKYVSSLSK